MAERRADWVPGVSEVPEVRAQLEILFKAVAGNAIELAVPAFQKLIELADGGGDAKIKDAARRSLLRLASRYPPEDVLAAQKAKMLSAEGEPPPMGEDERYAVIMALLIGAFMNLPPPKSRA
jgi:hypothetical protein